MRNDKAGGTGWHHKRGEVISHEASESVPHHESNCRERPAVSVQQKTGNGFKCGL